MHGAIDTAVQFKYTQNDGSILIERGKRQDTRLQSTCTKWESQA